MMSTKKYFAQYRSPNTVIVPTAVCDPPSPKKPKVEVPRENQSPQHVDVSFLDDFNIDEIVECLNNCESNDITLQEEVIEHTPQTSQQNVTNLSNESSSNVASNHNNGNNDKKDAIKLYPKHELRKSPNNNENGERNIEDKKTTNILIFENAHINQNVIHAIENLVPSAQCDQVMSENIRVQLICNKTNTIENNDFKNNVKVTDSVSNNINESITINNTECSNSKKLTLINNNISTVKNMTENLNNSPKDTTINPKVIIIPTDKIEKKETLTQLQSNEPTTLPQTAKQCTIDMLSEDLEKKMCDYLQTKYSVNSKIHHGQFSRIFKCQDSAGTLCAVKMLNNKSDKVNLGIKKARMLMDIQVDIPKDNLFCVYIKNTFTLNGYWCFLMEFYPKTLKQAMVESQKPFHINMVQDLARQLVAAVTLLRNNEIVHSDIKPSHILLNSSNTKLKLCGFDASYYIYEPATFSNVGSISYRSPEIILGYSAGFSIDVWSTALILYEMATGKKLFSGLYRNWEILYKQMCTFGNIPNQMLSRSFFKNTYFLKGQFRKQIFIKDHEKIEGNIFKKTVKVSKSIYDAYYSHWAPSRTKAQKAMDVQKIKSLLSLLDQMLVIYPNNRLRIEFVYANPFIYEMFDC